MGAQNCLVRVDLNVLLNRIVSLELENAELRRKLAELDPGSISPDTPIEELFQDLPGNATRILNSFRRCDAMSKSIRTVGELVQCSELDLICRPNFGTTSLSLVREALTRRGLRLRDE